MQFNDSLSLAHIEPSGVMISPHIANATMRSQIEAACRSAGYAPAIICTPDELMEPNDDNQ